MTVVGEEIRLYHNGIMKPGWEACGSLATISGEIKWEVYLRAWMKSVMCANAGHMIFTSCMTLTCVMIVPKRLDMNLSTASVGCG